MAAFLFHIRNFSSIKKILIKEGNEIKGKIILIEKMILKKIIILWIKDD